MHLYPVEDTVARWAPECPVTEGSETLQDPHKTSQHFWICMAGVLFSDYESELSIFVLCAPASLICAYILRSESGSAVCLPSIRGSVFLNASVKRELTCSGRFPPAYCYKQHLSRSGPCTRRAWLYPGVCMYRGESFKFIKSFSIFSPALPACLLHVFLPLFQGLWSDHSHFL